jgi:2-polyprenyl-3-methyl-5-hydroxy-6-metoxy-1,4-benzoquinol methylase
MNFSQFLKRITEDAQYLQEEGIQYAEYHARRFYITYETCIKYLKKGDQVLSIGAGCGIVEKMLKEWGAEVTVVDFEAGIERWSSYFSFLGIKTYSANLIKDKLNLPYNYFDMLLCSEIVEHIPQSPQEQLQNVNGHIKIGGVVVVTTPNLGSILHIVKLLFMRPIFEVPEKTFGEVNFENQAIHRREYLPSEINYSFTKLGYKPIKTIYFFYTYHPGLLMKILSLFGKIIPRFRPGILLIGSKSENIS